MRFKSINTGNSISAKRMSRAADDNLGEQFHRAGIIRVGAGLAESLRTTIIALGRLLACRLAGIHRRSHSFSPLDEQQRQIAIGLRFIRLSRQYVFKGIDGQIVGTRPRQTMPHLSPQRHVVRRQFREIAQNLDRQFGFLSSKEKIGTVEVSCQVLALLALRRGTFRGN